MKKTLFSVTIACFFTIFLLSEPVFSQPPQRPDRPSRGERRSHRQENADAGNQAPNQPPQNPQTQNQSPKDKSDAQGPAPDATPVLPLDQALEKAGPTTPVLLNQDVFVTEDQCRLVANYYKGNADQETIPVILLHKRNGNKEEMEPLALFLAEQGMSVLVPDLRGHGQSTQRIINDFSFGNQGIPRKNPQYTVDKFTYEDFLSMIDYDGMVWYEFLKMRHNQKTLNLRKLVIVGSELGGTVGAGWASYDWKVGNPKKGQFAKALILLSPNAAECLPYLDVVKKRKTGDCLKLLLFAGTLKDDYQKSAQEIQEKIGGKPKPEEPPEERKVPLIGIKTELQGAELLTVKSFGVGQSILDFINLRMESLSKTATEWSELK